jgi:hypothetical protein
VIAQPTLPVRSDQRRWGIRIEAALALLVLAGVVRLGYLTIKEGYFPQPFFWDVDDTFRDWFSTAIWAHESGAYDTWLTIYPPLSFVILKIVGIPSCYVQATDKIARSCDWLAIGAIHLNYIVNAVLVSRIFMKIDRPTAWQRSVAITVGMPMLFGLERGNLILLCFTFMMLGFGPLVHSARWRWMCVALAVNLKIYLIAAVFAQLLRRKWLWFEGVLLFIIVVYLGSYAIYGAGTPVELVSNLVNYATGAKPGGVIDFIYPNTFIPLRYILAESETPVNLYVGSDLVSLMLLIISVSQHSAQAIIVLACIAVYLRPEVVPAFRVTFFGVALAMITSETSPYTQPLMFLFVFMERWRGWARPLAIVSCYLLCIPGDYLLGPPASTLQFSYISQRFVFADIGLALGMFVRPLLFMFPAYLLGAVTILDVCRDIRNQGWATRWRFRRDWPLLPGVLKPLATRGTGPTTRLDTPA